MMRTKLKEKLHSRRGASITFALLLFMVCAAIGSVVLASATATAGRASGNYEYDQRYYAVTSAAELLRETLDGQSVTFKVTKTSQLEQSSTYTVGADGELTLVPGSATENPNVMTPAYRLLITRADASRIALSDGPAVIETPSDLLGLLATSLVKNKTVQSLYTSDDWLTPPAGTTPDLPGEMTLTVGSEEALTVKVKTTLGEDGSLQLELSNAGGSETYVLTLMLLPDVRSSTNRSQTFNSDSVTPLADENSDGVPDRVVRKEVFDVTEDKTATVTWRVSGVGKAA